MLAVAFTPVPVAVGLTVKVPPLLFVLTVNVFVLG
jgi:hypothetical protein